MNGWRLRARWARVTLVLKRLTIWLAELGAISISLGLLLRLLWGPFFAGGGDNMPTDIVRYATATAGVFVLGSGYLLTTFVFAVIWRSSRAWVYPSIAAALYVLHLKLWLIATGGEVPEKLPLQLLGALVIYAWTFLGGLLLKKWQAVSARRTASGPGAAPQLLR